MNIKTYILNANGQFSGLETVIETTIKGTLQKITSVMSIDNVDIVVSDFPRHIIPGYGLGGIAMTPYRVELYIDPKFPNINKLKKISPNNCSRITSLYENESLR